MMLIRLTLFVWYLKVLTRLLNFKALELVLICLMSVYFVALLYLVYLPLNVPYPILVLPNKFVAGISLIQSVCLAATMILNTFFLLLDCNIQIVEVVFLGEEGANRGT